MLERVNKSCGCVILAKSTSSQEHNHIYILHYDIETHNIACISFLYLRDAFVLSPVTMSNLEIGNLPNQVD